MSENYRKEVRKDKSIIFLVEKKFKIDEYLLKRIPPFITPKMLNMIGFFAAVFAGISFFLTKFNKIWFLGSFFGVLVYFFCDRYDGRLARKRKIVSKRGFYADHMFDTLAVAVIMLGLGLSGNVSIILALSIIVVYYILAINTFLITYLSREFNPTFFFLGPAEALCVLLLLSFFSLFLPYPLILFKIFSFEVTLFNFVAFLSLVILIFLATHSIIMNLKHLEKFERNNRKITFSDYLKRTKIGKKVRRKLLFINSLKKSFKKVKS
ncbi:MAG: CDP-alcohol phosphatidyltransferase family protein [Candidatus Pacearchaeota archaeon]|nr:CDP-alcohol phosphatidyltransferase family protein [Candidatus Pacearchaeota archaeon]